MFYGYTNGYDSDGYDSDDYCARLKKKDTVMSLLREGKMQNAIDLLKELHYDDRQVNYKLNKYLGIIAKEECRFRKTKNARTVF